MPQLRGGVAQRVTLHEDALLLGLREYDVSLVGNRKTRWHRGFHNSLHTLLGSSMALTIDHREISIRQVYDGEFSVEALPLGDFMIEYADEPDKTWLAERKTARDLGESIKSGRWADQLARLFGSGHRIVVIIEGDLNRDGSLPLKNLMGAIINASMLGRLTVHRTWDYHETACLLKALLVKMANWGGGPPTTSGLILSKRKREGDERCCQIRMLCCIPNVSEVVAVALLDHFGDFCHLQQALSDKSAFPRVSLGKTFIGKARIKTLRKYLCAA